MTQHAQLQPVDVQPGTPDLSVVITIVSGAKHLKSCLAELLEQVKDINAGIEIIVPFDETNRAIARLMPAFPAVGFYAMRMSVADETGKCHEHFDEFRAAGLQQAGGRIVALLEDHEKPASDWCRKILEAHRMPHAAVGGAVENGVDRVLNWAACFFDFGRYQNPVSEGPSTFLTDVNVAYKQEALEEIRQVWEDGFHEPAVHAALLEQGKTLWLSPDIIVYQNRVGLGFVEACREKFIWGRYFSGNRVEGTGLPVRMVYCVYSLAVPAIILAKMSVNALKKRRLLGAFIKSLPASILLIMSWSAGELTGYLTGRKSRFSG